MTTRKKEYLKEQAATLPSSPGIYRFLDREAKVIYVGKAKNLRKRVSSYFVNSEGHSAKVRIMVRHIVEIEHVVVATEGDALLLENNLIKRLQPRYNILLKDDKTYPWIVVRNEPFPRVESTRKFVRDGSKYYGPYSSIAVQRNVLELVHSLYPIRTCALKLTEEQIKRGKYRVCLEYHIDNCKGPCIGEQSEQEYAQELEMVMAILGGSLRSTREHIEQRMARAAVEMNFELADRYKTRLALLENYESRSIIVHNRIINLDVFSTLKDIDTLYCNFVKVRDGAVVNTFTAQFSLGAEQDDRAILTRAIEQISEKISGKLSKEVVVPFMPEEGLFDGVKFVVPERGDKLKLLEFSQKNARVYRLEQLKNIEIKDPKRHIDRVMEAMKRELRLEVEPRYIECFDNSNLQGTNPVSSCVVFRDGKPSRREYRHFNVKSVEGADDYATMQEVVYRRYSRLLEEGAPLPDLVVIDGGKGQIGAAYGVLKRLNIDKQVPIVALAERLEEVYFPADPIPYYLERTGEPLKVLINIRNEAHRFGVSFHRTKRSQSFIKSELESIAGVGEATITKLMRHFRGVTAIKKATKSDLAEVVGSARAESIYRHFHPESDAKKVEAEQNTDATKSDG